MRYDAEKHNRRSIRLKGYNYSQAGAYFVTICTNGHECLFGTNVDGNLRLNYPGEMIVRWWRALPDKFSKAQTDQCIVMPNHFHGIIMGENLQGWAIDHKELIYINNQTIPCLRIS